MHIWAYADKASVAGKSRLRRITLNQFKSRRLGRFLKLTPPTSIPVGVCLVVVAMLAVSCSSGTKSDAGSGSGGTKSEVKVGFVVPYSGIVAKYGQDADHAWQLAIEKYGSTVNGHKLSQAKFDEKCQPAAAVAAVRQALSGGVVALIGPTCSADVTATMALSAAKKIPLITQAYAPTLTTSGNKFIWRMPASDTVLNANQAEFLKSKGSSKVGVAHDSTGFGQADGQTLVEGLKAVGIEPAAVLSYAVGSADFSGEIQRFKAANVDTVCIMGYDPATAKFAFQMKQLGLNARVCSNQAISYADSLKMGGAAIEDAFFYAAFLTDVPRFKPFVDTWRAKFNEDPDAEGYNYYLSAVTVIQALKNVSGEVTGEKLNAAIGKLNLDVDGMTTLAFTDTGDMKCPTVLMGTITGGRSALVQDNTVSC